MELTFDNLREAQFCFRSIVRVACGAMWLAFDGPILVLSCATSLELGTLWCNACDLELRNTFCFLFLCVVA